MHIIGSGQTVPLYNYKGENVYLRFARYELGRLAIELVGESGEPYCRVTTNMPEVPLNHDEFLCKDWSENEGMAEWLVENKIAERTGRTVQAGYANAPVMRRLI